MAPRVTNVTTAFSSSSQPPAFRGQANPLYVTWSGLCSYRFVFLQERPWQSIMIFRAIWQEAGSGYSWPWNDTLFCDPVCAVEHFSFDWSHPVVLSRSAKFYSVHSDTTNTSLSTYKSGNMFRLIEPSSGQFTNRTGGTFSSCAHCGIPQNSHLYKMRIQVVKSKHNYKSVGVFIKQTMCFGPCTGPLIRFIVIRL